MFGVLKQYHCKPGCTYSLCIVGEGLWGFQKTEKNPWAVPCNKLGKSESRVNVVNGIGGCIM